MHKLMALSMAVAVVLLAACGTAATPTASPVPEPTEQAVPSIGLVIGLGGEEDGGFNELALAGVTTVARRLGTDFAYEVANEDVSPPAVLEGMVASGDHDIIVTVGFDLTEATVDAAEANPDIHFVGIDQFQVTERPNLTGVIFPDDQAGFLAGYLAGSLTQSEVVGGVYGPDEVAPIQAFAAGYRGGVAYANEDVTVLETFHPEGVDVGFADVAWGEETATAQLAADADVIFTAAGDTGRGALIRVANEAANTDQSLYCIGVDTDQWQTATQARPCLVSSAVKAIPQALDEVISQVVAGDPPAGNYLGPVGLAPFHDFDSMIGDELKTELDQLAEDLTTGVVDTGYAP